MKLDYVKVTETYKYFSKVKYLFEHAFPEEERPPFKFLFKMDKNQLFGIDNNGEFIGLLSLVEHDTPVLELSFSLKNK